jgi:uncharacterized MAPEG superfamily protein
MSTLASTPAFVAYAFTTAALSLLLLLLWARTGAKRASTKTTPNVEDTSTVAKGAKLATEDPEAVARAMRVYQNASANVFPFLALGLVWVLLGAAAQTAWILFGIFVLARLLHAVVYSAGLQPWRTLSFVLAQLATVAVLVQVVRGAVASM